MAKPGLGSALAHIMGRTLRRVRRREPGASRRAPAPPAPSSARVGGPAYPGDFRGPPRSATRPTRETARWPTPARSSGPGCLSRRTTARARTAPVLVIGHDGPWLLALPLTSKDHDRDVREGGSRRSPLDGHRVRPLGQPRPRPARSGSTGSCGSTLPEFAAWERPLTKVGSTRSPRRCEGRHPEGRPSLCVELRGFEPLTPSMPWRCATSCATAPHDCSRACPVVGTG